MQPFHFDDAASRPADQADGLRRLFAQAGPRLVPVAANPYLANPGALLEPLCAALVGAGASVLLVDAADGAPPPAELARLGLAGCIEPLAPRLGYLAARGLPMTHLDADGSTAPFLQAVIDAAPGVDVVLVHAGAVELGRLFARQTLCAAVRPLLLADDRPASVTHAYAAMKLLVQRARLMVHHLLLGAGARSPRTARIAEQTASCAELFLGAVLHSWAPVDPAAPAPGTTPAALARLARALIDPATGVPATSGVAVRPPSSAAHECRAH